MKKHYILKSVWIYLTCLILLPHLNQAQTPLYDYDLQANQSILLDNYTTILSINTSSVVTAVFSGSTNTEIQGAFVMYYDITTTDNIHNFNFIPSGDSVSFIPGTFNNQGYKFAPFLVDWETLSGNSGTIQVDLSTGQSVSLDASQAILLDNLAQFPILGGFLDGVTYRVEISGNPQMPQQSVFVMYVDNGETKFGVIPIGETLTFTPGSGDYKFCAFQVDWSDIGDNFNSTNIKIYEKDLTDGLVAYYPFNGNANDESGNGNDGTVYGAQLTNDRFGNGNSAYYFDGIDDRILVGDVDYLNGKSDVTLSVWVKFNEHSGAYDPFISKGAIAQYESQFTLLYTPGGTGGLACQFVESFGLQSVAHSHPNSADDGVWHHIVARLQTTVANIYIDGIETSTYHESNCSSIRDDIYPLMFGSNIRGTGENWLKGALDDIRIYDYAISEAEILELYHEGGWPGGNSLVAYYPFNGNANDESGNGYDGIVSGATLINDRFENPNSAYDFDGNDYIDVPNGVNFEFGTEMTAALFMYVENVPTTGVHFLISNWAPGNIPGSGDAGFSIDFDVGDLVFVVAWLSNAWEGVHIPMSEIPVNEWFHVAGVRDANELRFYLNGVLIAVDPATEPSINNPHQLVRMGSQPTSGSSPYTGKMDQVRIYDRALSETEILELYHEDGWPGGGGDLVAYYPFNGNYLDESGNNNILMVSGNPSLANDRFGNPNRSYEFSGNSEFFYISNGIFTTTPSAYTLSVWFKADATGPGDSKILYEASSGIYYRINLINDVLYLQQSPAATGFVGFSVPFNDVTDWHHAILKWDGDELIGYLDGQFLGAETINSTNTWNLGFGIAAPGTAPVPDNFDGRIDDIRIYDRALSEAEILDLYHEGGGGTNNTISVLIPNGGEVWGMGTEQSITWSSTDVISVKIEFSSNNGATWDLVTESTPSTGIYLWTVPAIHTIQALVKITNVADEENNDQTDDPFTIEPVTSADIFNSTIPDQFELKQNYPNPFNPTTTIYYGLPYESSVRILIFDILGSNVMRFTEDNQPAGYHNIKFDASNLPSGIYFYRIQVYAPGRAGSFVETKKMILLK